MTFDIVPAVSSDLEVLAQIHTESCRDDLPTTLKGIDNPNGHYNGMLQAIGNWIDNERLTTLKVIDTDSNKIAGFIVWLLVNQKKPEINSNIVNNPTTLEEDFQTLPKTPEGMNTLTGNDLKRFWPTTSSNPDDRTLQFMGIVTLTIHPDYHGKGLGTKLIKYGTEIADQLSVPCYVSSSQMGVHVFKKNGFQVVRQLDLVLDDFVPKSLKDDRKVWGNYTYYYLVRPIQSLQ